MFILGAYFCQHLEREFCCGMVTIAFAIAMKVFSSAFGDFVVRREKSGFVLDVARVLE